MKIITGHTGEPHIKPEQDRAVNQGLVGADSCILNVGNNLAAEVISANEIRILDGVLSHQGCFGIVETGTYDTMAIANGAQGMQRKDLIVCRYQKTGNIESLSFVVIQGTAVASNPTTPAYNTGLIATGDSPVDFPLYRVNIDGITITSVDRLPVVGETLVSMRELIGNTAMGTTATTVTGAIKEHQDAIEALNRPLFITRTASRDDVSISANGWIEASNFDIAVAGYRAIAIRAVGVFNATHGGVNQNWIVPVRCYIFYSNGDKLNYYFWNQNPNGAAKIKWEVSILYGREELLA